jgi:phosphoenolpyruvate carboxykinase (GTP)
VWPGFGENMRVLEWIVHRCQGRARAVKTPLGNVPAFEDLTWKGLESFGKENFSQVTSVDRGAWQDELKMHDELLASFASRLPSELDSRRQELHRAFA